MLSSLWWACNVPAKPALRMVCRLIVIWRIKAQTTSNNDHNECCVTRCLGWQVKDKLLSMAREACQTCLNDMHSRTQLLIVHPSVLNDFCSYMVCPCFHAASMPCHQSC